MSASFLDIMSKKNKKKPQQPTLLHTMTPGHFVTGRMSLKCQPLQGSFIWPMVALHVTERSISGCAHRDPGVELQNVSGCSSSSSQHCLY